MTSPSSDGDPLGPVVELWIDDHADGSQSILLTGHTASGDAFTTSFFQPPTNDPEEGTDCVRHR